MAEIVLNLYFLNKVVLRAESENTGACRGLKSWSWSSLFGVAS